MPVKRGNIPWNKGKKGLQVAWNKGKLPSKETRQRMSLSANKRVGNKNAFYGKKHSDETKKILSFKCGHKTPWNKGKELSLELRKKLSASHIGIQAKEKHPLWKGGFTHQEKMEKLAGSKKPETCEVCGAFGRICFDHNHETGKFRGWICHRCNVILGFAKDNGELLKSLMNYLTKGLSI